MKTTQKFKLSALSVCLSSVYGVVLAADVDVDALAKPDSSVSVGAGNWSGDRHQQGIYDGMRDKGTVGLMDADINKRDEETGTWLKLRASNLGLESREVKAEYLRQGDMGVTFEYSRTPSVSPYTFSTRLQGIGSTTQTIQTTAGTNSDISLGTKRDLYGLGFTKRINSELDLSVSFKNEDKTGSRAWGVGVSNSNPYFTAEPINSTTRQLETALNYTTKALQLSGGYYGSWYTNNNDMLTLINANGAGTTTFMSLPLDNQAHQAFLNGGYNFTSSTRGTFKVAYTHATQNQGLANQGWASSPQSLNGAVNTTLLQAGVTSRLTKDFSVLTNLRYHNVDDATPISLLASTPTNYMPWSYKTLSGKVEGTYRLPKGFSLTSGVDFNRQDRGVPTGFDAQRAVPYRYKVDETTYRVQLRRAMSETVNGAIAYLYSTRAGSSYGLTSTTLATVYSNQINPINIANRTRNKVRMSFDWTPVDALTLQMTLETAKDNYAYDHDYGVRDGSALHYGLDANYAMSENWSLNSWYSYDRNHANQVNFSLSDSLLEVDHSFGFGTRANATERLKFGSDVVWTRGTSTYQQAASQPSTLEPITNVLFRAKVFSLYTLDKHSELRFDLIHERWKTNDWTWMFANGSPFVYGGAGVADGTTVTAMPKQISNYVGARYIYRFQ